MFVAVNCLWCAQFSFG